MSLPLPSGLPDAVGDNEDLARILRQSSSFSSSGVKPSAFLPAKDGATSVVRHGAEPPASLWNVAIDIVGVQTKFYGAAIVATAIVRKEKLDVVADEPPPRHANIIGWPSHPDPDEEKARRKEVALALASASRLLRKDQ